ncbi:hypothetical protein FQA39_LY08805 [Lamprigera yunnana]|nr:hypothetical protein FQA39_LY08805 [Lamprigera yunnana]
MYLLLIGAFLTIVNTMTLPPCIPKCYINDPKISECIMKTANKARPRIATGIEPIGIPPFNPLILRNFVVTHKALDANFTAKAENFTFYGMQHYEIVDVGFCPKKLILKGKVKFGNIHAFTSYCMKGHIISIPVTGKGYFKGLMGPGHIDFIIKGESVKIRDVEYIKLRDVDLKFTISTFLMNFKGLQQESGPWGDTNNALRAKPEAVAKAVAPVFQKVFEAYLTKYLKWFFKEVSFSELFPRSH